MTISTYLPFREPLFTTAYEPVRLLCFPHAGAGASMFAGWQAVLPPTIQAYPIQLPGHETRLAEPVHHRLEPLVDQLLLELAPLLDRPVALFGHSMGALIAFELARALRRPGRPNPTFLIVSGCRAPQLERGRDAIHHLPSEQFLAEIVALDGTPDGVLDHPELRDLLLPILRADFTLCETYRYRPGPPLTCPIIAYGGLHDAHVCAGALAAWRAQSAGPFGVRLFPGDHFFFRRNTQRILRALADDLQHAHRTWTWQMT